MKFQSKISEQVWKQIHNLLLSGYRAVDAAEQFGVSVLAIRCRNQRDWKVPLRKSARRGPICPQCNELRPSYRSSICRSCYNASRRVPTGRPRGDRHPLWKGGISAGLIRFTPEYKAWRKAVFQRDNHTCQHCFVRGGKLHAHHLKPQCARPDLRLVVENGLTLCVDCHRKTETWGEGAKHYKEG